MNNLQMKRWGLSSVRSDLADCWMANCEFLPVCTGTGSTMDEAITSFLKGLPQKDAWREIAPAMLGESFYGNGNITGGFPFESPEALWTSVVDNAFVPAYGEIQNVELVNRVYTFSEWCLAVDELAAGGVAGDLRSAVHVIFYEAIPSSPLALKDLPNWFSFAEIQTSFFSNPFMSDYIESLRAVFDKPK